MENEEREMAYEAPEQLDLSVGSEADEHASVREMPCLKVKNPAVEFREKQISASLDSKMHGFRKIPLTEDELRPPPNLDSQHSSLEEISDRPLATSDSLFKLRPNISKQKRFQGHEIETENFLTPRKRVTAYLINIIW